MLQATNVRERNLRMPCCDSLVVAKKSRHGTRFFAHKAIGACVTAPETEAHLRIKRLTIEVARSCGWDARSEVAGVCPLGESWRADVLAKKDGKTVAVEIQWSPQTLEETYRRQSRYARSGVRGLWLLHKSQSVVSSELPMAVVATGSDQNSYSAFLPISHGLSQKLSLEYLLRAAFSDRLRFGLPRQAHATITVKAGLTYCYSCGAETKFISQICIAVGPQEFDVSLYYLTDHLSVFSDIKGRVAGGLDIGEIRLRYSKTLNRSYLSNGCRHCDALFGDFFAIEPHGEETIAKFNIQLTAAWRKAISDHGEYHRGWFVYDDTSFPSPDR